MDAALAAPMPPQTLIPEPRTLAEKFAALPLKPLLLLGAGTLLLASLAIALALRSGGSTSDWRVLYSGLSDKDGGAVIAQLAQMNVPYRHSEGGGAIMVPPDQVLDVRMRLSNLGLPKNSVVGYELLDTQRFGQTQAGEGMSMKRATEGELMRTIGSLAAVQQVRVHLAIPNQNGFFREQQKPSASVMLTLHPGRMLDRSQIAGIVHLVSSSVPELSPKAVSIVDGQGNLLTNQEGSNATDTAQLQYRQQLESTLRQRVLELLEPVVGSSNLRATITADVDFSETMLVSEEFKPNNGQSPAAVKTLQTLESNQPGAGNPPAGVPGAQTNQPPTPPAAPINGPAQALQGAQGNANGGNFRREATTAFEVDRTQRTTRAATGSVRRVSAAVVVNHRTSTDARGRTSTTPLSEQEIRNLTSLVEQAVGFDAQRGDAVRVISAPFRAEPKPAEEAIPLWKQPWVLDTLRAAAMPAALAFVALLIVMTTIRPALKTLLEPPKPADEPGANVDTVLDETPLLPGETRDEAGTSLALTGPKNQEKLEEARQLATQNPAAVANIVRSMMTGEPANA
jgi:flagellar M-ring protein FliF